MLISEGRSRTLSESLISQVLESVVVETHELPQLALLLGALLRALSLRLGQVIRSPH